MATRGKTTRNSTETFFGGGMGVLTVSKRRPKSDSNKNSEAEEQSSAFPQEWRDQIFQEAKEQMGFQPEKDESDCSPEKNNNCGE